MWLYLENTMSALKMTEYNVGEVVTGYGTYTTYTSVDEAIAAYRAKMARRRFFWQSFKTLAIIAGAFELATIVAVFAMH
jgi:hypothetical protein